MFHFNQFHWFNCAQMKHQNIKKGISKHKYYCATVLIVFRFLLCNIYLFFFTINGLQNISIYTHWDKTDKISIHRPVVCVCVCVCACCCTSHPSASSNMCNCYCVCPQSSYSICYIAINLIRVLKIFVTKDNFYIMMVSRNLPDLRLWFAMNFGYQYNMCFGPTRQLVAAYRH